jgi:hypothetical protein
MRVYLDESGDLGWSFVLPYRHGGSSRYLSLAFLFIPKSHYKVPASIIADLYKKYGWRNEKKASGASDHQKIEFAKKLVGMMEAGPEIKIDCIVVKKENVLSHITADSNKLYNYMCKLVVIDYVQNETEFEFIPDKRTIKVESGNSLSDYLQTVLWFETTSRAKLKNLPEESHGNYNLQFVDWVANIVWSYYEDGKSDPFNEIVKRVKIRKLFF